MPIAVDGKVYKNSYDLEMGRPVPQEAPGSTQSQGGTPVPLVENNAPAGNVEGERGIVDNLLGLTGERYQTWPERAVRGAIEAFALPGDVYSGKVQPGSPQEIERAMDLAGLMVFGPAPVAKSMAEGTLGSFIGVKSKTFPHDRLKIAQKMEAEGAHPDDIWKEAQMFNDKSDGRWKAEIGDEKAKLVDRDWVSGDTGKISEFYEHPTLYEAYPFLKDVNFEVDTDLKSFGAFSPSSNTIYINPRKVKTDNAIMDIISHELQHKIQEYEGFSRGSSAATAKRRTLEKLKDEMDEVRKSENNFIDDPRFKELNKLYDEIDDPRFSLNSTFKDINPAEESLSNYLYTRTPGEVEANIVIARRLLNEQQRRNWSPQQMLDWLVETKSKNIFTDQKYRQPLKFLSE